MHPYYQNWSYHHSWMSTPRTAAFVEGEQIPRMFRRRCGPPFRLFWFAAGAGTVALWMKARSDRHLDRYDQAYSSSRTDWQKPAVVRTEQTSEPSDVNMKIGAALAMLRQDITRLKEQTTMRDSGVEVPRSTGWGIDPATVKLLQDAAREAEKYQNESLR